MWLGSPAFGRQPHAFCFSEESFRRSAKQGGTGVSLCVPSSRMSDQGKKEESGEVRRTFPSSMSAISDPTNGIVWNECL